MLTIKQCLALLVLLAHHLGAGDAREEAGLVQSALSHYQLQQAVPVIHLTEEQYSGKASVSDYLRMFPNELLASNKRVKPIDVRKIEHEDFIDYEIEFIELPAFEENQTGTEEFILKTESSNSNISNNKIQNDSLNNENSAKKSEKSKEMNLVNFVDLVRRTKTKAKPSRSRAIGDRRRRRRIKLKRDPGRSGQSSLLRQINPSSNQINTEQSKRDQNIFSSETHVFTKPRTIIRNLIQLPETARKSSVLDRRTNVPRVSNIRARKRVPLKSGRSFYRDDKPSDQLIRLRNSEIITKLERSTSRERNVIRTKTESEDDLDDKKLKQEHVTENEEDEKEKTIHILNEASEEIGAESGSWVAGEDRMTVMSRTGPPLKITTTRSMATEPSIPGLMMYPEVFTTRPQHIPVTETSPLPTSQPPATSISLISVFGSGKPRSSRLQIAPVFSSSKMTTVSNDLKFSIISTSTQTSVPLLEATTHAADTSAQLQQLQPQDTEESQTKTSNNKSSTTSLPVTTSTLAWEKEVEASTRSEDWMMIPVTEMTDSSPDTTTQQIEEDESKFPEVTTAGDPGSIRTDNQMTTSSVSDDLQLSESITSVYLHNSSVKQSVKKNIETSEMPNKETVNSIKMFAPSETRDGPTLQPPTVTQAPSERESIFTVTPSQYVSSTRYHDQTDLTSTTTPYPDGQYLDTNPGPYEHDTIGDTAEPYIHDERANYLHDPTGDTAPPYQHDPSGEIWAQTKDQKDKEDTYSNLDTNYPGDYEVNEVKVDFDNQDEHKIYNVQAKAGDFIIGEVGRIDINNGQTVEGVRYTALQGEVDPLRIRQILNRFFGARTS